MSVASVPVFVLRIADVQPIEDSDYYTVVLEPGQAISDNLVVPAEYVQKYGPVPGGYYVMCSDGSGLYSESGDIPQ